MIENSRHDDNTLSTNSYTRAYTRCNMIVRDVFELFFLSYSCYWVILLLLKWHYTFCVGGGIGFNVLSEPKNCVFVVYDEKPFLILSSAGAVSVLKKLTS